MNLVGKIFVFLVFVMSAVFATFATMVYYTHTNWRQEVVRKAEDVVPGKNKLGWKYRFANEQQRRQELGLEVEDLEKKIHTEKAAHRQQLAKAEAENSRLQAELDAGAKELASKENDLAEALAALKAKQKDLSRLTVEVGQRRHEIQLARNKVEKKFDDVVETTDKLHQVLGEVSRLKRRNEQLTADLAHAKRVLREVAPTVSPKSTLDLKTPPTVEGKITDVRRRGKNVLVEISIGADDGLRIGHQMEVFRGANYLGKIEILITKPDRAAAKVIRQKAVIKPGDSVATEKSLNTRT